MEGYTLETVIKECETFKVEVEGSVLSAFELAMIEISYIRGQQNKIAEALAELKEVA
jgi:hypothetical protein